MSSTLAQFLEARKQRAIQQDRPNAAVRQLPSDPYSYVLKNRKRPIDLRWEAAQKEVLMGIRSNEDILEQIVEGKWPNGSILLPSKMELRGL